MLNMEPIKKGDKVLLCVDWEQREGNTYCIRFQGKSKFTITEEALGLHITKGLDLHTSRLTRPSSGWCYLMCEYWGLSFEQDHRIRVSFVSPPYTFRLSDSELLYYVEKDLPLASKRVDEVKLCDCPTNSLMRFGCKCGGS